MVIRRIGVLSLGKISAAIHGAIGLVLGVIFALASLIGGAMGQAARDASVPPALSMLFGFAAIIFMPLIYAVLGFVIGILSAFVYNAVAKLAGGVELDVEAGGSMPPSSF
jgi:hypothetical protein